MAGTGEGLEYRLPHLKGCHVEEGQTCSYGPARTELRLTGRGKGVARRQLGLHRNKFVPIGAAQPAWEAQLPITDMCKQKLREGIDGCMRNTCMDTSIIITIMPASVTRERHYVPGLVLSFIRIISFKPPNYEIIVIIFIFTGEDIDSKN